MEKKTKVFQYDIKANHPVFNINGKLFVLDYPDAASMARLLAFYLEQCGMRTEAWKKLRKTRDYMAFWQNSCQWAQDVIEWVRTPFPTRHIRSTGTACLVASDGISPDRSASGRFRKKSMLLQVNLDGSETVLYSGSAPFYVRPCLIPLAEDGTADCEEFAVEHVNGQIIRGGTLYVDGMPSNMCVLQPHSDYCIDESYAPEWELFWICWEGKLLASKNLWRVYPSHVQKVMGKILT